MNAERTEALRQEWRDRLTRILEPMLPLLPGSAPSPEDPLLKHADPGPPVDVQLPGYKRHNFAMRRRTR